MPRVAGHHVRPVRAAHHEGVGGQHERRPGARRAPDQPPVPFARARDHRARRGRPPVERSGPRGNLHRRAGIHPLEVRPGEPEVLLGGPAAGRLGARAGAQVPLAAGLPAGSGDPVRVLDDHPVGGLLHLDRRAGGAPVAGRVPPGAHRRHGQPDRPRRGQHPVRHGHRRVAVPHRQFPLDDHVADPPAPPRHTLHQGKRLQVAVSVGRHHAARPLVRVERDLGAGRHREGEVEGGQAQVAGRRRRVGHGQQRVVAAGAQAADGAGGVPAEAVGHQPLVVGATVGAANVGSENDRRDQRHVASMQDEQTRSNPRQGAICGQPDSRADVISPIGENDR